MIGRSDTVAVVGAGHVGASVANALVLLGVTDRVVLYDRNLARADAEFTRSRGPAVPRSAALLEHAYRDQGAALATRDHGSPLVRSP